MKKLKLNCPLHHKAYSHDTVQVEVEKVITLYGSRFQQMRDHPLEDCPEIAQHRDLMYMAEGVAHCLLFVDSKTGDGLLVEAEGYDYARNSHFVPNAKAILENNEITNEERQLHRTIMAMADRAAELAHKGEEDFQLSDLLIHTETDVNALLLTAVAVVLRERQDIESTNYSVLNINDAVLTSYVKIVKKDAETGNIIPVAGIGFKVWNCDTESYVVQEIKYPAVTALDTFYTDETGTLMLPNELVYGNYELHEVQSANGYVLDSTPVPFTIDGTVDTVVVEKTNKPQKGKISVQKSGDAFASVIAGETLYTPVFEETGLAGAVFEITAAEDIVTADGTIRAKKGDVNE